MVYFLDSAKLMNAGYEIKLERQYLVDEMLLVVPTLNDSGVTYPYLPESSISSVVRFSDATAYDAWTGDMQAFTQLSIPVETQHDSPDEETDSSSSSDSTSDDESLIRNNSTFAEAITPAEVAEADASYSE